MTSLTMDLSEKKGSLVRVWRGDVISCQTEDKLTLSVPSRTTRGSYIYLYRVTMVVVDMGWVDFVLVFYAI